MAKKSKLRKIHIGKEQWKWIIEGGTYYEGVNEIRIYSPDRVMFRVKPDEISSEGQEDWDGIKVFAITPSDIKNHIINHILPTL